MFRIHPRVIVLTFSNITNILEKDKNQNQKNKQTNKQKKKKNTTYLIQKQEAALCPSGIQLCSTLHELSPQ